MAGSLAAPLAIPLTTLARTPGIRAAIVKYLQRPAEQQDEEREEVDPRHQYTDEQRDEEECRRDNAGGNLAVLDRIGVKFQ